MKRALIVLAVIAGVLLSACHKEGVREEYDADGKTVTAREFLGGDPNHAQYYSAGIAIAAGQKPLVSIRAKAGESITFQGVESFEVYAPTGGGAGAGMAPPQPKRTFGDRVESIAKAVIGATPGLGAVYSGIKASDNARDVSLAQYGFLGGVVHDVTAASAIVAQSGPDITVGGNLGDTQTIGGDMIGGDRTETSVGGNLGDTSIVETTIGRDQIGGDLTDNSGVIGNDNDTRFGSPGPIDDHSDPGDDCSGSSCNPVEPAPAAPLVAPKSTDPVGDAVHELRIEQIELDHQLRMNEILRDQNDWIRNELRGSR